MKVTDFVKYVNEAWGDNVLAIEDGFIMLNGRYVCTYGRLLQYLTEMPVATAYRVVDLMADVIHAMLS